MKQPRKANRLDRELEEMGRALHRLGALSGDEYAEVTAGDPALDGRHRKGPRKPASR